MSEPTSPRRSRLVPLGVALVLLQLVAPGLLRAELSRAEEPLLRAILFLAQDFFRLGALVGVGLWIIGALRNRRWKKESTAAGPGG
jgi:hypothetical protein